MTRLLAQITAWLNAVMNGLGRGLLAPLIGALPGWLSNTIVAAVTGVLLLIVGPVKPEDRDLDIVLISRPCD